MRIYMRLDDIQNLRGCSQASASRYLSLLKDIAGKSKKQKLTVFDYTKIEQVSIDELAKFIDLSDPMDKYARPAKR